MLKRLFKDSAVYTLSSVISRGLSVLLVPLYTRVLSPADYGVIDILAVASHLITMTVALEITQGLARYYAEEKDPARRVEYSSTSLYFTFVMYAVFLLAALAVREDLALLILGSADLKPVMTVALFSI